MNQLNQNDMQQHVTIVGWLCIIGCVFFIVIGSFVFVLMTSIGVVIRDPEALPILSIVGTWTVIFMTVLALPGLIAGYGLLKHKLGGRALAIVVAFFGTMVLIIVRTALEDKTLQAELPGYVEYTEHTRYRLLPDVW